MHNIVHQDLKLANVLIEHDSYLVIADLGLAHSFRLHNAEIEQNATRLQIYPTLKEITEKASALKGVTRRGCGTVKYIAPEVYCEQEYGYPMDVWAFGVIVYELLLGKVSQLFHMVYNQMLINL